MSSSNIPIVAIVGRANVGKSSLFNSVLRRNEAITAREAGTTRDSVWTRSTHDDHSFWLIDTAGMKDAEDEFEFTIQEQIIQAADSADIIWVVIEADAGISEEDRRVAKLALKSKKTVYLVVNKIDKVKKPDLEIYKKFGIKEIFYTTASQNRGIRELLDRLIIDVPQKSYAVDPNSIIVSLIGRPNVGKSALFNSLAKKQQAIVSGRAGTTRDTNKLDIKYNQKTIKLIDTAGIRRSGKIETGVEKFSVIRSISAIEQSDICLLLMDANELNSALDQKLAGMIKEAGKGLVLVVAKWDSLDKDAYTRDSLAPQISNTFDFVPWAPLIFTSSITGQNVTKIFDLVLEIHANRQKAIKTRDLNNWLAKCINMHPPAGLKNRNPKLNYMVHEEGNPTPSFKIFGSHTKFLHWSYKRYLEQRFREQYGYQGTAIKFWFIERTDRHKPPKPSND